MVDCVDRRVNERVDGQMNGWTYGWLGRSANVG